MPRAPKQLERLARQLLAGMRAELGRLLAVDLFRLSGDRFEVGRIRYLVAAARDGILELSFDAWLGHVPDRAERRAASRALARLESAGLVERLAWGPTGCDTTHVRLTTEQPVPAEATPDE